MLIIAGLAVFSGLSVLLVIKKYLDLSSHGTHFSICGLGSKKQENKASQNAIQYIRSSSSSSDLII